MKKQEKKENALTILGDLKVFYNQTIETSEDEEEISKAKDDLQSVLMTIRVLESLDYTEFLLESYEERLRNVASKNTKEKFFMNIVTFVVDAAIVLIAASVFSMIVHHFMAK